MLTVPCPRVVLVTACAALSACAHGEGAAPPLPKVPLAPLKMPGEPADPPFDTSAPPVVIRNATVLTATTGDDTSVHAPGHVVMQGGRIVAVGPGEPSSVPEGAEVIDAAGKFVTPGIIDTHSHVGVYAIPSARAHSDGNEAVRPATPEVWAEHGFWPQDPNLWRAVAGGVTTVQVLPGSANLIGGRSFVAKLRPATSARMMRFPGAPEGLKMACGENPKRVYGDKGGPQTRMGNVAGYRAAFQDAYEYRRKWHQYERDLDHWHAKGGVDAAGEPEDPPEPPARDFGLETLAAVLDGRMLVHNHCYRADEMHIMLDLAEEFGFTIRSFHHALEAYKLADRLAEAEVAASTWADWWGFKMEAFDGIPQNAAMVSAAGGRAIIHSDDASDLRTLNVEAAKAMTAGHKVGLEISRAEALRWITYNAAWALGIHQQTGSLAEGMMADVVLWNGDPLSVYSRVERTYIDGHLVYDRAAGPRRSDFELGLAPTPEVAP